MFPSLFSLQNNFLSKHRIMAKNTNMLSPSRTELNNISDDETSMSSTCSPQWRTAYNSRPTISSPYALQPVVNSKQTSSVGLSDPALSELRRKKLETVNRLHSIGLVLMLSSFHLSLIRRAELNEISICHPSL